MEELRATVLASGAEVRDYVARRALRPGPVGRVGVELELFVLDPADPVRIPGPDELRDVLGAGAAVEMPGGSRLTFEPGGQLELSGPPLTGPEAAVAALEVDLAAIAGRLAVAGLALRGGALEATRVPYRWVRGRRYDAMAAHFRGCGPQCEAAGAVMMTATAALQLNLDAGVDEAHAEMRWQRAHVLAPTLAAMFAASPVLSGRPSGAASGRLAAWQALDRCRTAPVFGDPTVSAGQEWARYALDATVFLPAVGEPGSGATSFTLRQWADDPAVGGRRLTSADVDEHLTTLFPPIRPRGFVELRYLDGQQLDVWPVAVAVVSTLHDDPRVAPTAAEACLGVAGHWAQAAQIALADPDLACTARDLTELAIGSLIRRRVSSTLIERVEAFADRYVRRERTPADDVDLRSLSIALSPVADGSGGPVFVPAS